MELKIGPHRVVVEDDILIAHVNQPLQLAELRRLLGHCESIYARFGSVYLVTIVGPRYELSPEGRKLVAAWGRDHVLTRNMIVGASFGLRTMIALISRAQKLLGAQSQEVDFPASEAEARSAIARHKASQPAAPDGKLP